MPKPFAVHPGEILLTEFMEPLAIIAYRLTKDLHVRRSISADTALRLGRYFNLPAQFWLNLQNEYDLRFAALDKRLNAVKPRQAA